MTQAQLDCVIAASTGESVRTIHRLGFGLLEPGRDAPAPEDLRLVLDCPFCHVAVPYPGPTPVGPAVAECDRCDVDFDFRPEEVYVTETRPTPAT